MSQSPDVFELNSAVLNTCCLSYSFFWKSLFITFNQFWDRQVRRHNFRAQFLILEAENYFSTEFPVLRVNQTFRLGEYFTFNFLADFSML